jgi:hypothetical protein
MAEAQNLTVYIDYKSPYAYLAKDLVYDLEPLSGSRRLVALCAGHPELSRLGAGR